MNLQKNRLYKKLAAKLITAFERAEPNITIVGVFAPLGYPIFYYVWSYLLPQPYENLTYRIVNAFISLPLLFYKRFSGKPKKYFPVYFFIAAIFLLPFFFGFMLYKNEWNTSWFLSTVIGFILLVLLIDDWFLIFLLSIVGYILAYITVWFLDGQVLFTYFKWIYVPNFLFLLAGTIVMSYRKQIAHQTKISLLHSLSGSVAHEMRNPLNSIINAMGSVQSILPDKPGRDEAGSDYTLSRSGLINLHDVVEKSTETVLRANKIIDSILADMQGKSLDLNTFKRVAAKESIQYAISSFSYDALEDRKLIKNLAKTNFDFFGDKDLFIYVLFNLIKNALYYKTKPGFGLEIATETGLTGNTIRVRDTGPGIPASKRERIFDSFYTSGKESGVGLGLSFCKHVVTSFGGLITCDSKENEWTEFTIHLPFYNSKTVEQLKKEILHTKNILVVDGSPANRLVDEKFLNESTCNIEHAENGAQALSILSRKRFDLILMDIDTPVMKGDEAARHIRTGEHIGKERAVEYKNIPIIGISASPEPELKQRALDAGMNGYITKPLTRKHLLFLFEDCFFSENKQVINVNDIILENRNVLIVDDNLTSRKFMSIIFEHMGAHVIQAENGKQAITCLEENDCDIVFMDMEMPVMNGVIATQMIREGKCFKRFTKHREIPIIALTGNTDAENIALSKQSGMNAHLGKPVSKDELVKILSIWLAT